MSDLLDQWETKARVGSMILSNDGVNDWVIKLYEQQLKLIQAHKVMREALHKLDSACALDGGSQVCFFHREHGIAREALAEVDRIIGLSEGDKE